MEREMFARLREWKEKKGRKPLVLFGARQVGKTWLLQEFGRREYENTAYINCDNNPAMAGLFFDYDIDRLLRGFSAVAGTPIRKEKTLIILDEIQEVPLALTSLKYFQEKAPEYHIAAAGSLLGLSTHQGTGYPVGKTDELTLYPLSFHEFLRAQGKDALLDILRTNGWEEIAPFREILTDQLRQYYYVGGMPGPVREYIETNDIATVRDVQNQILRDYENDFSKHIPPDQLPKVRMIWNAIPSQLAKENKKLVYSQIRKGARGKDFETAIQWLTDAGLVYRVNRVSKVEYPLKFYEDPNSFKLFMVDLGLLGAMSQVQASQVLAGTSAFVEYKGAFTEQYVCQALKTEEISPWYHSNDRSTLEIDFVIQTDQVYPIEVKAEENLRSKSLKTVVDGHPGMKGWRFSMSGYREQDWMINVPLYMVPGWVRMKSRFE